MAGFIQIIEFRTSKPDQVSMLGEEFRKARTDAGDVPSPIRLTVCADRDDPGRYFNIVEFASYEEAMANNERADTGEFAAQLKELCDGPPTFYNLDVEEKADFG